MDGLGAGWGAGLVLACGLACAQPGENAPTTNEAIREDARPRVDMRPRVQFQPPAGERADEPKDPAAMRIRLERRLADTRRLEERLEEAVRKLEAGAAPEEVMREFELPGRMRGEDGPRRGGPDGERPRREGERPDREGRGPGGEDAFPPVRPGQALEPHDRERIMAFVNEHLPVLARRMDALRDIDAQVSDRMLMRLAPRLREAAGVQRRDPELFGLRLREIEAGVDVLEAVKELREAKDGGAEPARATLRAALGGHLDARLAVQRREVESLAKRLEEMRADLQRREGEKSGEIDEMLRKIESQGDEPPRP